ncbi:YgaP family membrane protein [Terriglobus sp. ADX1]|uniref:YgaP family membrane protein n=1 Tax=Terriglobus sp. ADX1 TaxID=2794063 RepID=UPI002FE6BB33
MDDVNVGALDMFVRFLIGMALFSLATLLTGNWRWLALLGFVPLLTAAFRFCPLWAALGICTCEEQRRLRAARHAH